MKNNLLGITALGLGGLGLCGLALYLSQESQTLHKVDLVPKDLDYSVSPSREFSAHSLEEVVYVGGTEYSSEGESVFPVVDYEKNLIMSVRNPEGLEDFLESVLYYCGYLDDNWIKGEAKNGGFFKSREKKVKNLRIHQRTIPFEGKEKTTIEVIKNEGFVWPYHDVELYNFELKIIRGEKTEIIAGPLYERRPRSYYDESLFPLRTYSWRIVNGETIELGTYDEFMKGNEQKSSLISSERISGNDNLRNLIERIIKEI